MFINPVILCKTNCNIAGFFSYKTVSVKLVIEGKRQVICWIENHFKKIDNYIEN